MSEIYVNNRKKEEKTANCLRRCLILCLSFGAVAAGHWYIYLALHSLIHSRWSRLPPRVHHLFIIQQPTGYTYIGIGGTRNEMCYPWVISAEIIYRFVFPSLHCFFFNMLLNYLSEIFENILIVWMAQHIEWKSTQYWYAVQICAKKK